MALITRVARLFRADMHAVLDRMEEPELLLKQAIREMEEALDQDQRQRQLMTLEAKQIAARLQQLTRRLDETERELDLCFDNGNETLARNLLRRKLEARAFAHFLEEQQQTLESDGDALDQRIAQNRSELEHLRQKASLLSPQTTCEEQGAAWREPDFMQRFSVNDDDVELALLRERQKRVRS